MPPDVDHSHSSASYPRKKVSKSSLRDSIIMSLQQIPASEGVSFSAVNNGPEVLQYIEHDDSVPSVTETPEKEPSDTIAGRRRRTKLTSDPFDQLTVVADIGIAEELEGNTVTFRAVVIGLFAGGLGAAISQMFMFKPVQLDMDPLFIQLFCLVLGRFCAIIPGPLWWNPGPIHVKETVFSAIIATTAAKGAAAIEGIATQRLLFNKKMSFIHTILLTLSTQLIGYGIAGTLRPLLVYPSRVTFPSILPCVALFRSMSVQTERSRAQLSCFKKVLIGISLYEIIPTYLAPALQSISPFCLTMPQVDVVTNLFGGSLAGEGMGFLAISLCWVYVGSHGPMFVPLAAQITQWVGYVISIFLCMLASRKKWFGGGNLPFIAYGMFEESGKPYSLSSIIFQNGTANMDAIAKVGFPYYPSTMVLCKALLCLAASGSITIALFHTFFETKRQRSKEGSEIEQEKPCPHRTVTENLPDFHVLGYVVILLLSLVMAVIASRVGHSGLSLPGLLTSLSFSCLMCLGLGYFEGTIGQSFRVAPVVQMIGGLAFPGNAHGMIWFSLYGAVTVHQCVDMLKDLKLGQYMHLAPRTVVIAQLGGTIFGAMIHYVVMIVVLQAQADTLMSLHGDGVFTGMNLSILGSDAVSWGLFTRDLYFPGKRYVIVPIFLILGLVIPIPFLIFGKLKPSSRVELFNPSLMASAMANSILGATSGWTMAMVVGFLSQYVMRKYHFSWFKKYNYVLCAALDGGTQITVFLIALIFQGAAGLKIKFPTYALNPKGPRDYCVLNTNN